MSDNCRCAQRYIDPMLQQYLHRYAEPEIFSLNKLDIPRHEQVLIIPAYDEAYDFLQRLTFSNLLVILVINQPDSMPTPSTANLQLLQAIQSQLIPCGSNANLALFKWPGAQRHLLLVDRFTTGRAIPQREGVGLARKIAADIAVALITSNIIGSRWIYSSDCDATLPADYFDYASESAAALTYPFRHSCDTSAVGVATRLYEFSLRYYQRGLCWAGSPYGFLALGSALAFRMENYCQVRGFPKRAGGEDFYLLNKLAKTGKVLSLTEPIIQLQARLSQRAPFGTGPAVGKIMALANPLQDFTVYNPECFNRLKAFLAAVTHLATKHWADRGKQNTGSSGAEQPLSHLDATTQQIAAMLQVPAALAHASRQSGTPQQFLRHFTIWFDALKTLRFIHLQRDSGLANVPIDQARTAAFTVTDDADPLSH